MKKILILLCTIESILCNTAFACTTNEIDVLGNGSQCETAKFTITTTNLSSNKTFAFFMSAMGVFYVDWGDGTIDTITRTDTTETLYNHTYTTAGVKTIRFGGLATGYDGQNDAPAAIRFGYRQENADGASPRIIASLSGSIGQIMQTLGKTNNQQPRFIDFCSMCTSLTSISETVFLGVTGARYGMFERVFYGCQKLSEIHSGLFVGITSNATRLFFNSFCGCISLTNIPTGLFSGITGSANSLFRATFERCSSLRSIPEDLFAGAYGGAAYMFRYTFKGCTGLTSIPENLFENITIYAEDMFFNTFRGCTGLHGYISPKLFSKLVANGSHYATDMMTDTFYGTNLATTCPTGTVQFITGYEDYWGGHVSCVDENLVCGAGEYLPAHWYQCEKCPENNYCVGGTYPYSETVPSGATQCPNSWYSPVGMWESAQCGRILHVGDNVVYLRSAKKTTPSLNVDIDNDGVADFFGNMTVNDVVMNANTDKKLKLQYGGQTYSVYDDSVNVWE